MNEYINQTLGMLQKIGMDFGYPEYSHKTIIPENKTYTHIHFGDHVGSNAGIDHNARLKFTIMFSLLDAFIDAKHPKLEGKSFSRRYKSLPKRTTTDRILKELYRLAKVLRNALIHSASKVVIASDEIRIGYTHDATEFSLEIKFRALNDLYTAVIMFAKGDLGDGAYFEAFITTLYAEVLFGVRNFQDEFGSSLLPRSDKFLVSLSPRPILLNPKFSFNPYLTLDPDTPLDYHPGKQGMDLALIHKGVKILIPIEAVLKGMNISETDALTKWRYQGTYPPFHPKKTTPDSAVA